MNQLLNCEYYEVSKDLTCGVIGCECPTRLIFRLDGDGSENSFLDGTRILEFSVVPICAGCLQKLHNQVDEFFGLLPQKF